VYGDEPDAKLCGGPARTLYGLRYVVELKIEEYPFLLDLGLNGLYDNRAAAYEELEPILCWGDISTISFTVC
jgi:hypothetical protein